MGNIDAFDSQVGDQKMVLSNIGHGSAVVLC